jgi:hypothetical protein
MEPLSRHSAAGPVPQLPLEGGPRDRSSCLYPPSTPPSPDGEEERRALTSLTGEDHTREATEVHRGRSNP